MGCYAKNYDNLLVETDIFATCNAKHLQFHMIKKQEHRGTAQKVLYSPMSYFF